MCSSQTYGFSNSFQSNEVKRIPCSLTWNSGEVDLKIFSLNECEGETVIDIRCSRFERRYNFPFPTISRSNASRASLIQAFSRSKYSIVLIPISSTANLEFVYHQRNQWIYEFTSFHSFCLTLGRSTSHRLPQKWRGRFLMWHNKKVCV